MNKIIAYYRVSTKRQGASGLGLEGQHTAVDAHARGTASALLASYTEVESGKRSDRPQLALAIAHARLAKATLVVAKLDRLARNVAFLSALMESRTEFVACDNPNANTLTLHILAAVAEEEAKAISQRTRTALGAAKKRGILLGSSRRGHWRGREDRRALGQKRATAAAGVERARQAHEAYEFLLPSIRERRAAGESLASIAAWLNASGHQTAMGRPFGPTMIHRLLARA